MTRYLTLMSFVMSIYCWLIPVRIYGQPQTVLPPQPQPTNKPATLTFEELREGVRKYYNKIQALEVEYSIIQQRPNDMEDLPLVRDIVPETRRHFALKGEKRYAESDSILPTTVKPNRKGAPKYDKYINAYDSKSFRVYRPSEKQGQILKDKHRSVDLDFYASSLFIPISDEAQATLEQSTFYLPNALDYTPEGLDGPYWSVRPTLETVDGFPCHVLESKDLDRIWVDPSIGFAARFRSIRHPLKSLPPNDRPLMQSSYFTDYAEVGTNTWLPKQVTIVFFADARSPQNFWNRPNLIQLMKVSKIKVNNDVPDSLFSFRFPPGTTVTDYVEEKYYYVTGKSGEEKIAWVIDMAEAKAASGETSWRSSRFAKINLLILVVLILVTTVTFILRRRRNKVSTQS